MSARPELDAVHTARLTLPDRDWSLEGVSVAGLCTWLAVRAWSLGIDCGAAPPQLVRCRTLALTHAHLDHAGGLGTWLALRRIGGMGPSTVLAPAEAVAPLRAIVDQWEGIHGRPFDWQLIGMKPGDRHRLRGDLVIEALPADHVIPALGWAVWREHKRLKPTLRGLDGPAIRALKQAGEPVHETRAQLELAVSGDTRATSPRRVPQLREAAVSLMECTFLDERCTPEKAHKGGHTHLDELRDVPWACKTLVPYHISLRYDLPTARRLLAERLAPALPEGVTMQPLLPALPDG